jgi:sugar phosphate isomerase/epimerase
MAEYSVSGMIKNARGARLLSRREWHRMMIAALAAAPCVAYTQPTGRRYKGVTLGAQSYSFRDMPLDEAIDAMRGLNIPSCELWQDHVEPAKLSRDEMRRWRETVSLDHFHQIGKKFQRAGIVLSAYNISFKDHYSAAEIERGFEMAKALGAPSITASANIKTVPRVAPVAARHRMKAAMHNHSTLDPNEFATPEQFEDALRAGSHIAVNLDIGHFTAANFDAVDFLRRHHASIVTLHIKDRKRDQGAVMPFGDGDAPIGSVLRMLRDNKWDIPANIEYEYDGSNTVEEVRRCLEYCRRQLDS